MKLDPVQLNYLFQRACIIDLSALKPGNVGWHGAGHDMYSRDFMLSAAACGKVLCHSETTLGERILSAVQATQKVVTCNTNLGIILLCAPVIQAIPLLAKHNYQLQAAVQDVLEHTTVADAEQVFEAIRLARPGGMGRVQECDISEKPTVSLRDTMALAAKRDRVAAEYCNGYHLLFDKIIPVFIEFCAHWYYHSWSATGIYLLLLSSYPDDLISRKQGLSVSARVTKKAKSLFGDFLESKKRPQIFESQLLEFDKNLKERKINPGTTADLVVAGVFIASLEQILYDAGH